MPDNSLSGYGINKERSLRLVRRRRTVALQRKERQHMLGGNRVCIAERP